MNAKLKISVLIPTEGRNKLLERCLLSILNAEVKNIDFEYVVGINNSDILSEKTAQKCLVNKQKQVLVFNKKLTPAQLRNELIPYCSGDYVFFIDDDAYVTKDFFSTFESVKKNLDFDVIGGPNLTPPNSALMVRSIGLALQSRFATLFSSARYYTQGKLRSVGEASLILCNLFVKRTLLGNSAFFPALECAEEAYLIQNLSYKMARIYYSPDLFVFHERRSDLFLLGRQVYKYGFGRGQLARLSLKRIHIFHFLPLLALIYSFVYLTLLITFETPVWMQTLVFLYFAILLSVTIKILTQNFRDSLAALSSFIVFPVIHFSYALGLANGLLRGLR